jgi:hypothetical protein
MELFVMQFSTTSCHFFPPQSKYCHQNTTQNVSDTYWMWGAWWCAILCHTYLTASPCNTHTDVTCKTNHTGQPTEPRKTGESLSFSPDRINLRIKCKM